MGRRGYDKAFGEENNYHGTPQRFGKARDYSLYGHLDTKKPEDLQEAFKKFTDGIENLKKAIAGKAVESEKTEERTAEKTEESEKTGEKKPRRRKSTGLFDHNAAKDALEYYAKLDTQPTKDNTTSQTSHSSDDDKKDEKMPRRRSPRVSSPHLILLPETEISKVSEAEQQSSINIPNHTDTNTDRSKTTR